MNAVVKICGIRTVESAQAAVAAGADYLGLNFSPSSKRLVDPKVAKDIVTDSFVDLPIVGIFQNAQISYVNELVELLELDYVQLHGQENMDYIRQMKTKVIKVVDLSKDKSLDQVISDLQTYTVDYFLIDREVQGIGEIVDLEKASIIAEKYPVFFAGGLNSENVGDIIRTVRPYGVDVASGIETDGKEDYEKMKLFVEVAKGVEL